MAKKKQDEKPCVYVYLGPSIRGVIQSGTIYYGKRGEVIKSLGSAINERPKIALLIFADSEIVSAKSKIKTDGSLLNRTYRSLLES